VCRVLIPPPEGRGGGIQNAGMRAPVGRCLGEKMLLVVGLLASQPILFLVCTNAVYSFTSTTKSGSRYKVDCKIRLENPRDINSSRRSLNLEVAIRGSKTTSSNRSSGLI